MSDQPSSLFSKVVHSGERRRYHQKEPTSQAIPVAGPIHTSVSHVYDDTNHLDAALGGDPELFVYHRYGNPTVAAFERAMVELECHDIPAQVDDHVAFATGSGMAAIQLAMMAAGAGAGATIAAGQDCYGATYSLINSLWPNLGARGLFVDTTDLAAVERLLAEERPKFLLIEAISNPLLKVTNVRAVADLCHRYGALLLVDNTFATPILYRPLKDGADFVIHSATKFIGGHGDVMAGVVITHRRHRATLWDLLKKTGSNLGPQEAWLLLRGLKTLALRVERQFDTAHQLAAWLTTHPGISHVYYPGLPSHPHHLLGQQQFGSDRMGAVVAFEIAGADREQIFRFFNALQMIQPATSLGDVYSLILYPAHASHRSLTGEERAAIGIGDGLVRLSVGIEALEDIVVDLHGALQEIQTPLLMAESKQ
ncbi:MAG: PLP-dependent transferase [Caldilineaceae bacterium]|nr:PLP-dependent transferase [Caldilineaceae bacterium]